MEEKEQFYAMLGKIRSEISRDERVVICGDFNGHVGKDADGFEGVHGGYSFGVRNAEGEMLLEFAEGAEMLVANTCFKKKDHRLITYASGEHRTVVDYVLIDGGCRGKLLNADVLTGEPCLQQHRLLLCVLDLGCSSPRKVKKEPFVSRIKIWKLKEEKVRDAFMVIKNR